VRVADVDLLGGKQVPQEAGDGGRHGWIANCCTAPVAKRTISLVLPAPLSSAKIRAEFVAPAAGAVISTISICLEPKWTCDAAVVTVDIPRATDCVNAA